MNESGSRGHGKESKGEGKEMLGKATGSEKTQAEDEADQVEGP